MKNKLITLAILSIILLSFGFVIAKEIETPSDEIEELPLIRETKYLTEHEYTKNYQVIHTPNINFEMQTRANHYWKANGKDLYEVIIYNMNIKGYSNHTLRLTWEDERYLDETIRINYTIRDGILNVEDIEPYSISKNSKMTFSKFKVETMDSYQNKIITTISSDDVKETTNIITKKEYTWKPYQRIDLKNPNLNYLAIDDVEVGGCGTLSDENGIYVLNQSISGADTCITISANNVTLDCAGFNITYSTDGTNNEYGIYSNQNLTNIRNCVVEDGNWTTEQTARYGIYFLNSNFGSIINSTVNVSQNSGIHLYSSSNNTLTSNTATSGTSGGIYLYDSSNNTLTSNTATSGTYGGIRLYSSSNNTLTSNTATSGTWGGIYLYDSSNYNTLTSNTATSEKNDKPFRLDDSTENIFENNIANYYKLELESNNNFIGLSEAMVRYSNGSILNEIDGDINLSLTGTQTLNLYNEYESNQPLSWNKIEENTGTTAYDSSGNSNDGTISGATWNNDGILNTLTSGADYTLNVATGVLTLASDYLYSWIETDWEYYTKDEYGFHLTIIKTIAGLTALIVLSVAIYFLYQLYNSKELE